MAEARIDLATATDLRLGRPRVRRSLIAAGYPSGVAAKSRSRYGLDVIVG